MEELSTEIVDHFVAALELRPESFYFEDNGDIVCLRDGHTQYGVSIDGITLEFPYPLVIEGEARDRLGAAIQAFQINHVRQKFNMALTSPHWSGATHAVPATSYLPDPSSKTVLMRRPAPMWGGVTESPGLANIVAGDYT